MGHCTKSEPKSTVLLGEPCPQNCLNGKEHFEHREHFNWPEHFEVHVTFNTFTATFHLARHSIFGHRLTCHTSWHSVTHRDTSWHTVTHHDTPWHIMTQRDTSWHIVTRGIVEFRKWSSIPSMYKLSLWLSFKRSLVSQALKILQLWKNLKFSISIFFLMQNPCLSFS